MLRCLLLFVGFFCGGLFGVGRVATRPVEFFVCIPSYNNEQWCERNLEMLFSQTYTHWVMYYIDDCSTDKTGERVERYVKDHGLQDKCTIVHNAERKRAMANYVEAVSHADPHAVVVSYDADDFFAEKTVLEKLARLYENPKVWLTYGSYRPEPEEGYPKCVCRKLTKKVQKKRLFRKHKWVTSQLRTFYAALFHKIDPEDLKYYGQNEEFEDFFGEFVPAASDLAMMFPMLEMASKGHIHYVRDVIYIYNRHNANDCIVNRDLQLEMDRFVRSKKRYRPLKKLFSGTHKHPFETEKEISS